MEKIINLLKEDLNFELDKMNLYLVSYKISGNKIMVNIDHKSEKLNINQCAIINNFLSNKLEENGLNMEIEVSSPGLYNPFLVDYQYKKHKGRYVDVVKKDGNKIDGILMGSDEKSIIIKYKINKIEKEEQILIEDIKKTSLKVNF